MVSSQGTQIYKQNINWTTDSKDIVYLNLHLYLVISNQIKVVCNSNLLHYRLKHVVRKGYLASLLTPKGHRSTSDANWQREQNNS